MRELQVCPPSKWEPKAICRLAFSADGSELVAWVGVVLHAYDLRTDTARVLFNDDSLSDWNDWDDREPDLLLSPDRRFVAFVYYYDADAAVHFEDVSEPNGEREWFPDLPTDSSGHLGLMFTADGKELIAVRNYGNAGPAPDVARLDMTVLAAPPKRIEERTHPLTRKPYQYPIRDLKWKRVMDLPHEPTSVAALSTNGRLVAVGTKEGTVHVADLKKKKTLASFAWEGRKLRDRAVRRVGFDPAGKWVASIANGRLRVRPLGAGKAWHTKETLGRVNAFAFHPDGRVLCAVFEDGQARFLDPHTGAVRQSFQWAKKPAPLYSVVFAPDGLTCAVGAEKGKVIVWDVDL